MEISLQKELEGGQNVTVKIDVRHPEARDARPNSFSVVAVVNGQPRAFNFTQRGDYDRRASLRGHRVCTAHCRAGQILVQHTDPRHDSYIHD